jgi:hypothetical protein
VVGSDADPEPERNVIKQTKIAEIGYPKELAAADEAQFGYGSRKGTAARKAWLAAKVAEISALPNRSAKIVGQGSYQCVSVYEVIETASRTQFRGTCQVCGGVYSTGYDRDNAEKLSFHGYQRPGWGYTIGQCWGHGHLPAELDITVAQRSVAQLTEQAARAVAERDALIAEHNLSEFDLNRAYYGRKQQERAAKGEKNTPAEECYRLAQSARDSRRVAEIIVTHIIPRHGKPLYEVEVAE